MATSSTMPGPGSVEAAPRRRATSASPHSLFSTLALSSPARASSLRPSAILSSSSWLPRLRLTSQLGASASGDTDHGLSGHRVAVDHPGHTGCVNTLDWSSDGELLASSGDDTKICIWQSSNSRTMPFQLTTSIATGHTANVFSIKFAPSSGNTRLFSCAGDSQVRIFDINQSTNSETVRCHSTDSPPPWTHHDTSACTRVLRCHTDRVKRIATEWSPEVFLTCSEDGTVRQHDLRTTHVCRATRRSAEGNCGPPLLSYPSMSLYSLAISALRPHLFVVAGTSPFAYMHDRRMLKRSLKQDWGMDLPASHQDMTMCVRRFGVPAGGDDPSKTLSKHIVSAELSDANPRDLLVSYSSDSIYLFDTDADAQPVQVQPDRDEKRRKTEEHNREQLSSWVDRSIEEETSERLDVAETLDPEAQHEMEMDSDAEEDDDDEFEESGGEGETDLKLSDVPLVFPIRSFSGHANSETVKDVNWAWDSVVTGSDDGNWFAFDKSGSGDGDGLKGIWRGDDSVVNVIEAHPRLPLLAVSGIDSTIKIFSPSDDTEKEGNLIAERQTIADRNKTRARSRPMGGITRSALLALLARNLPEGASAQLNSQSGAVNFILDDGTVREGECIVM